MQRIKFPTFLQVFGLRHHCDYFCGFDNLHRVVPHFSHPGPSDLFACYLQLLNKDSSFSSNEIGCSNKSYHNESAGKKSTASTISVKFVWRPKRVKSFTTQTSTLITRPCKCKLKDRSAHTPTQLARSGAFRIPRIWVPLNTFFHAHGSDTNLGAGQPNNVKLEPLQADNNWPSRQTAGRYAAHQPRVANVNDAFGFFFALSLSLLSLCAERYAW